MADNFADDLARLEQIRRSQRSARPKSDNPPWMNSSTDCDFLLSFIDKLWKEYVRVLRDADRCRATPFDSVPIAFGNEHLGDNR